MSKRGSDVISSEEEPAPKALKPSPPTLVSIIGTAGREGARPMDSKTFEFMVEQSLAQIGITWGLPLENVHLVSGGAAWADHVAVDLFLRHKVGHLTLHLPSDFIGGQFEDNGKSSWTENPGKSANRYHREFSKIIGRNTLAELHTAIQLGAAVVNHQGFHARNAIVAKSPFVVAFTWGKGDIPAQGGTRHTWNLCTEERRHISLADAFPR
jgi:hypothetical protein